MKALLLPAPRLRPAELPALWPERTQMAALGLEHRTGPRLSADAQTALRGCCVNLSLQTHIRPVL